MKKRCTKCKQWKDRDTDFTWRKHVRKRKSGNKTYYYPSPICKLCARLKAAAYRKKLKEEGLLKEAQARWEANRDRDHQRRYFREWYRLDRLKKGLPVGPTWHKNRESETSVATYDASGVAAYVDRFITTSESAVGRDQIFINGVLATEIETRALRRWRGPQAQVSIEVLDAMAVRFDLPLWELEEAGKMAA